ncbi:MAG: alpha/beta fold hydrolase [Bacteroidales bacterium]
MTAQPLQTPLPRPEQRQFPAVELLQEHTVHFPEPFPLECGAVLPGITVRYHSSHGTHTGRNVVWICHALTANSNPAEWWPTLVGIDKFFDPTQDFIICANVLGSCYGSTQPDGPDYPVISIRDMVQAHEKLRQHLGIDNIHLLIGGSSGGFQSVEWAVNHPHVCNNLCLIACSAQISPWATALNESQRMALHADPTFHNGNGTPATDQTTATAQPDQGGSTSRPGNEKPETTTTPGYNGLAVARSIALLSYRSYEGYCQTQAEKDDNVLTAGRAGSYQQYQGKKLAERFCAYSYYTLTHSLDSHNVGRHRGGVPAALSRITARTLCLGIDSDLLFPLSEIEYMARHIPGAQMGTLSSDFGHDGFLLEHEQITSQLCKFLNSEARP